VRVPAIDTLLPEFDAAERHEGRLLVPPERALAAALATRVASDPIVCLLFRLRGLPTGGTFENGFPLVGFEVLERTPTEIVFGMSGAPWRPGGQLGRFAEPRPGTVKMAMDLRAEPLPGGGSLLVTETRVAAVDERARRSFLRYWRLVAPFSALIRRRWLAAIARSAE
jgi:hypothetical protein